MSQTTTTTSKRGERGTLGNSAVRPDGLAKVQGRFAFSSDAWADNMLLGATLRSPHPHARIISIDVSAALAINGVATVITAADVPGQLTYGLIANDQPVFAKDVVRFAGEPIAAVAAIILRLPDARLTQSLWCMKCYLHCSMPNKPSTGRSRPFILMAM